MTYDLSNLVGWARNAAGDRSRRVREEAVATGETEYVLSNTGAITLLSVTVDSAALDLDVGVSLSDNVVTFTDPPTETADIVFTYALTRYSDMEIREFLADAAMTVQADLKVGWTVSRSSGILIVDDRGALNAAGDDLDPSVQQLLIYCASLALFGDKANQAADDAIMVKDGDTTIDTSKTSQSSEKAMERLTKRYTDCLRAVQRDRFRGVGTDNTRYLQGQYPDPLVQQTILP